MKTIAFENKNTLVGINSTLDTAEEKIGVLEDKWKKKRGSVRDGNTKYTK